MKMEESEERDVKYSKDVRNKNYELLVGHTSPIKTGLITQNLEYVITCSISEGPGIHNNLIRLWNIKKCRQEKILSGHTAQVNCLEVSYKSFALFSGSADSTVIQWDLHTGQKSQIYNYCSEPIYSISLQKRASLLYILHESLIIIVSLSLNTAINSITFSRHSDYIIMLVKDENIYLAVNSKIKFFSKPNFNKKTIINERVSHPCSLKISRNNKFLIYGSSKFVVVMNAKEKFCLEKFMHSDTVTFVDFINKSENIISASCYDVCIWDLKKKLINHIKNIGNVIYSTPTASLILTLNNKCVGLYEISTGVHYNPFICHNMPVIDIIETQDRKYIITLSLDSTARIWDSTYYQEISKIDLNLRNFNHILISSNEKFLFIASPSKMNCYSLTKLIKNRSNTTPKVIELQSMYILYRNSLYQELKLISRNN